MRWVTEGGRRNLLEEAEENKREKRKDTEGAEVKKVIFVGDKNL